MNRSAPATPWKQKLTVFALLAALVILAYSQRFIQDDAFISFQYARNLVEGHGLVFNPGERVEGYSNFLWVMLMTIPFWLGIDPVFFSQIAGLLAFAGTLYFCYRLAQRVLSSHESVLLYMVVLGTHYSFSAFATGGMETSLHSLLVVWGAHLTARLCEDPHASVRMAWAYSAVCTAALLTRLDSAIFVGLYFACLLLRRPVAPGRQPLWQMIGALAVSLAIYFAWKYAYYRSLLPNTFWVKAASDRSLALGWQYLGLYLKSYGLYLALAPALFHPISTFWKSRLTRLFTVAIAAWLAYVVWLGGDFMEFRLLLAVWPFVLLLSVLGWEQLRWRPTRYVLACAMVGLSLAHATQFEGNVDLESVGRLEGNVVGLSGWAEAGRVLGELFDHEGCEVRIATTPAGAIPFYSRLETIDMLGLNDAWVARHGVRFSSRPGHQRMAPHGYLMEKGAHLVLGQPRIESRRVTRLLEYSYPDLVRFYLIEMYPERIPADACVIEIPLNQDYKLTALYLSPSPCIDSVIAQRELNRFPIRPVR